MPQANVPTHPGREAPQQGLSPQTAPANPYFAPSQALQGYNSDMQAAQARQADAAAAKANSEAALIQQAQGLGSPQVQADPMMQLAEGIATIAAAFYPHQVTVRLSDFKTNEYRNLIGGIYFEPHEENPMLGFRGASRYDSPQTESPESLS